MRRKGLKPAAARPRSWRFWLSAIGGAIAIVGIGLGVDRLLVLIFERDYYTNLPREEMFWVGWPVIALVLGLLLSLWRYTILATALLLNTLIQAGAFLAYFALYTWTEPRLFFSSTWLYQLLFIGAFLALKRQVVQLESRNKSLASR